ncbi:rhomboid family intramembrane serine protease [Hyphococcus flavus]|uniref:Rhomboid family intramembrane serine protease n=1 Tax=Hyphococcus flavus TaxID=1866326 RepID=A0AAE9ZC54_9PROT|nr:rhomboid family intramembrane serine protease [Hyphococcus flavus]WDI31651.1 rhomboid family intramembrane serine protease [Hyphococcus flavus]
MVGYSGKVPYELRRPGGEFDRRRMFNVPGVVLLLVSLNVFVLAALLFLPIQIADRLVRIAAVTPKWFLMGPEAHHGWVNMLSPLISHMFLHAGFMHLALNMLWLLAFGAPVARRMKAVDTLKSFTGFASAGLFVSFYLLCGIAGALAFIAFHPSEIIPMVGASGAVSGLMGGLVRFAFNRSTLFGPEYAAISPLSSNSVVVWSFFIIIMNVAIGLFGGVLTGGGMIAWEAHIGGYLFGLLSYPLFERLSLSFR